MVPQTLNLVRMFQTNTSWPSHRGAIAVIGCPMCEGSSWRNTGAVDDCRLVWKNRFEVPRFARIKRCLWRFSLPPSSLSRSHGVWGLLTPAKLDPLQGPRMVAGALEVTQSGHIWSEPCTNLEPDVLRNHERTLRGGMASMHHEELSLHAAVAFQ
jgi:hypothetical protein